MRRHEVTGRAANTVATAASRRKMTTGEKSGNVPLPLVGYRCPENGFGLKPHATHITLRKFSECLIKPLGCNVACSTAPRVWAVADEAEQTRNALNMNLLRTPPKKYPKRRVDHLRWQPLHARADMVRGSAPMNKEGTRVSHLNVPKCCHEQLSAITALSRLARESGDFKHGERSACLISRGRG